MVLDKLVKRSYFVSRTSKENFSLMCNVLGLKSMTWSRYFVEHEVGFFYGYNDMDGQGLFKVYQNDDKAFLALESERRKEEQIRYDIELPKNIITELKNLSWWLRVSPDAFVEFSLEFACFRLIGLNEKYKKLGRAEIQEVFFLEHLTSNRVTKDQHLEFYASRLEFRNYGAGRRRREYQNVWSHKEQPQKMVRRTKK
jgi:hypothetical protein